MQQELTSDFVRQSLDQLKAWLEPWTNVTVAFSGGVDSTLVLYAAVQAKGPDAVIAVTADSPSLPRSELKHVEFLVEELGARHVLLPTDELKNPAYVANDGQRCFHCKQTLYQRLEGWLRTPPHNGQGTNAVVVDGTNADDLNEVRPGHRAAQEAGVRHPLVELGIDKNLVRILAKSCGLSNWDKPAMACLSSRIPVGSPVTQEKLAMIEQAEKKLKDLGFVQVRVRCHSLENGKKSQLARIELDPAEMNLLLTDNIRNDICQTMQQIGFSSITLDLQGYRLGGGIN